MANKDIQESIAKLAVGRPAALLDVMDAIVVTQQNFSTVREALAAGLRFLVDDFRRQAELVMDSGSRGKGAEATALRATASQLSLLADAVEKVNIDDEPTPPALSGLPVEWCGKPEDHGQHTYERERREDENPFLRDVLLRKCQGRQTRDLSGLDALIEERTRVEPIDVTAFEDGEGVKVFVMPSGEGMQTLVLDPPVEMAAGEMALIRFDEPTHEVVPMPDYLKVPNPELEAYLRGDELKVDKSMFFDPAERVVFAEPAAPPGDPIMPGRRLTFADLCKVPTTPAPEHLSHSQITTLASCGTQYRLSRLEPGVVERPKWASVGGTAFHLAVEGFEYDVVGAMRNPVFVNDRIKLKGGAAGMWKTAFSTAMVEQAVATPGVPPSDWKAGGRGQAEGQTWWEVEGEAMLRRYIDMRVAEIDRRIAADSSGNAMIEHAGVLDVGGVPVKVVLDQVWHDGGGWVIDDVKSGAYAPVDTFQLGIYAWYLRNTLGFKGRIMGRFWDARKTRWSEPVDLIEAHPWEEIELRVHGEDAKKRMGLYTPNPSFSGCGSCSVKHACPIMARKG